MRNSKLSTLPVLVLILMLFATVPGALADDAVVEVAKASPQEPAPEPQPLPDPGGVLVPGNHYKCYDIDGPFPLRRRHVRDQFGETYTQILRPVFLCNPAIKNWEPNYWDERVHLVCYEILDDVPPPSFQVKIQNQFGTFYHTNYRPRLLCVPSWKTHEPPPPTTDPTQ